MRRAPKSSRAELGSSVSVYVGSPGAGKTTLALRHAAELIQATGWPAIVVDLGAVSTFEAQPHVSSVREALEAAVGRGEHAYWTPRELGETEQLFAGVGAAREIVLLIDESHYLLARQRHAPELMRLMRAHRHRRVHVLLTTQALSNDVPQEALACAPTLYVMRTTALTSLERLEREYGLQPDAVRAQAVGDFFRVNPDNSVDVVRGDGAHRAKPKAQLRQRATDVDARTAEADRHDR